MKIDVGEMPYEEIEAVANDYLSLVFGFKRYYGNGVDKTVLKAEEI